MDNIFVVNPAASSIDILDSIHRKLEQAQAIADCISLPECNGNNETVAHIGGIISDLLHEIKQLQDI